MSWRRYPADTAACHWRERAQQRRGVTVGGADREVHVLQCPLERELRGIVLPVHLVELGVSDRRVRAALAGN